MANNDNKELEKLNKSLNTLLKAFERMGKTVAEATEAMLKAIKLMEEENRRKQDNMWYKQQPHPDPRVVDVEHHDFHSMGDQKEHSIDIHRAAVDMAAPGTTDSCVETETIYADGRLISMVGTITNGPKEITMEDIEKLKRQYHFSSSYDVMTHSDVIKFSSFDDGIYKIEKVFRVDRGPNSKIIDITEQYINEGC